MSPAKTVEILFVDDDDACLAPLAEALFAHEKAERARAEGAGLGLRPRRPVLAELLKERSLAPVDRSPRRLEELDGRAFDLVITLSPGARDAFVSKGSCTEPAATSPLPRLFASTPLLLHWELPHAPGNDEKAVEPLRVVRDMLARRIHGLLSHGFLDLLCLQRHRLERVLDSLDEGVLAHDGQRRIYLFNRAAEEITGLKAEEVLGRHCAEIFPPRGLCGDACPFCDGTNASLGRHESFRDFVSPTGAVKRLKIGISPMEVGCGCASGAVAAMRDITEITRLHGARDRRTRIFHGMVGSSPEMLHVYETIRQVAPSDYPVLVTGESGTGKELVAQAIHGESRRGKGPFIPINCGALPEPILESELFGHVRGAFTGAVRDKKGRFALADGGTLFLDEVGELSPAFQVKLLRVLQESRFEPVGGERTVTVDVRVVSATNRDLRAMVREGSFREDLYYRLCVVPIHLPPLRRRRGDMAELLRHFLVTIREETGKALGEVAPETLALLERHPWPGNVRQLVNALRHAAVRCTEGPILPDHLPPELRAPVDAGRAVDAGGASTSSPFFSSPAFPPPQRRGKLTLADVEAALRETDGNKLRAAKLLGVGRATLYRFLHRHLSRD